VTPSYLREYSHGVHLHTHRMFADYGDILRGRVLVFSSSDEEGRTEGGVPYGAISGYLARTQPGAIKRFYVLPYELARIKQVDRKYYLTLRYALARDIRLIVAPNPSTLLLLAEKMTAYAEELIRDIRNGTVSPAFLPEGPAPAPSPALVANPRRADELAALLRRGGQLLPAEVWPNLRLISCWKGGTMPLYLRKLPRAFGDCRVRDLGYMASEGRGATPLVDSGAGGVLNVTSHFFEFLPEERRDDPGAELLTCDQLEAGREYYIYFTTSSGLYRYDINDVVRVVDFYRNTPVIQFVRKGQGITSITGEKLTESQVTAALMRVVDGHGFDVQHFTACVEWGEPPRYAMYAELGDSMSPERCRTFLAEMEAALCQGNAEYETKRESQRLGAPVLKRVAAGTYQLLRQRRVAEGAPETQVKIPQLSTSMDFGAQLEVREEIHLQPAMGKGASRWN
ncbi:MAG TPA: GH3 auxin-responsive promoter family protein, partial [Chloroflexota bacterium]|nr:GH3 auxin-responsive promoter family protein [Chloroflexota bacterium]